MMNGKLNCGRWDVGRATSFSMTFSERLPGRPGREDKSRLPPAAQRERAAALTGVRGSFFGRGAAGLPGSQRVGGDHPELVLGPGDQIHNHGRLFVALHVGGNCRETSESGFIEVIAVLFLFSFFSLNPCW